MLLLSLLGTHKIRGFRSRSNRYKRGMTTRHLRMTKLKFPSFERWSYLQGAGEQ